MNRLKNTCHLARNRHIAHLYYRISNQFCHHRGEKNTANKITHDSNYELKKNKNLLYCGEVWSPFVAFWVLRAISLPSIVSESPTETNTLPLPTPRLTWPLGSSAWRALEIETQMLMEISISEVYLFQVSIQSLFPFTKQYNFSKVGNKLKLEFWNIFYLVIEFTSLQIYVSFLPMAVLLLFWIMSSSDLP